MLVLTRRPNEKILIPGIKTSIQVVSIKPGLVRLGIDAPADVAIFREEVMQRDPSPGGRLETLGHESDADRESRHALRNRLSAAAVGIALMKRQLAAGLSDGCQTTLGRLEQEFQALQAAFEAGVKPRPTPAAKPAPVRNRRALVVEDDHNERELLAGFLRMAGMEVSTVPDGEDALNFMKCEARPDVILMDLMMPRSDGLTTARAIRRDPACEAMKIFAVTGHSPEGFGDRSLTGIDRWFLKPLNPEALLRDLDRELQTVC